MVDHRLEECVCKQAGAALECVQVPDDAGAIGRGTYTLRVVYLHLYAVHAPLVVFHGGLQNLAVPIDPPNSHHALLTSTDHLAAVGRGCYGGNSLVVRIMDGVEHFATLGSKRANLSITPAADDTLSIRCKADAMTLQVGHCDAQQLPARGQMPYSNVAYTSSGKNLAVLIREGQIIDLVVVGCLDELVCQLVSLWFVGQPVHVASCSAHKKRVSLPLHTV
mmetsp:Transcript_13766/g.37191  ORF Transcript_13766/g.37191 Transcript_13766/m.37191 type:complete len:221 (-) Transcript_13766:1031-1693(-)